MNICRITRPPLNECSSRFPQREFHILSRLGNIGHNVVRHVIQPARIPNKYLSYGIGVILSLMKFRKKDTDVIIADNIESAAAAVLLKLFFRIPFVFDFIDDYSLIASHDLFKLRYFLCRFLERTLPRFADLVIVVDEHKRRFCAKAGVPEDRIILIPNGADTERFKPEIAPVDRIDRFDPENSKVVLFIGKINRYYRLEPLIGAAPFVLKKFPGTRFVMVGDGDNMEELKNLCRKLEVEDAFIFTGFAPPEDMPGFIASADVCFFPLPDSSALAIFEYMACGKPTVVPDYHTEKMGISGDTLPDNCLMKAEDSPRGVAEKINRLLEDRELRDGMGREARELVIKFHGWDGLARRFEAALRRAAKRNRRWES